MMHHSVVSCQYIPHLRLFAHLIQFQALNLGTDDISRCCHGIPSKMHASNSSSFVLKGASIWAT